MTEGILWLFATVVVLAVLRSVLGILFKGIADFFAAASASAPRGSAARPGPRPSTLPVPEALKKDPVCGTFVAPSAALRKTVRGETFFFCSPECRDKFPG